MVVGCKESRYTLPVMVEGEKNTMKRRPTPASASQDNNSTRSDKNCPTGESSKTGKEKFTSEQLVLLLEFLLEEPELRVATMCALQKTYNLHSQDAEVRHRWCELVVKHAHTQAYGDVEHFLLQDQAMGVYLYGELMVHEDPQQQALARRCLSLVQEGMDQSAHRVVEEMVL